MAERMVSSGDLAGHLLLCCCAAPESDHAGLVSQLSGADWQRLFDLSQEARALPLVARVVHRAGCAASMPDILHARWHGALRDHAIGVLAQAQAIGEVLRLLAEAGISPVALKGFSLALRTYPDPALRPLRDIDLLLEPEAALSAQDLLLGHPDFARVEGAGAYGLEFGHQLPEIRHRPSGLVIELHHRINARGFAGDEALTELLRQSATPISVLGTSAKVPAAMPNFLHLVEHASVHHLFANGPLVLADLHFLARHEAIDWSDLTRLAGRLGLGRALGLLVALAAELGAGWAGGRLASTDVPQDHLAAARIALLAGEERARQLAQRRRLGVRNSVAGALAVGLSRAFRPDPRELARMAGCTRNDARRWRAYPAWLAQKGRRFMSGAGREAIQHAANAQQALADWLEQGGESGGSPH